MELTYELLHELLQYDEENGLLYWRYRDIKWFKDEHFQKIWNNRFAGKEAGSIMPSGYKNLRILGRTKIYHRIIWWMHYGYEPSTPLDHINGQKQHNKIENLREVTPEENQKNHPTRKRSSNLPMGIRKTKFGKFNARITSKGEEIHLGNFDNLEDAENARAEAMVKFGFHENHGRVV
ncbi:HNH endonuclease protein [Rhizobium phage RHph_N3_19]|nr:HNH endonuclease protein [Rhizobium phage RHph_N3_19]